MSCIIMNDECRKLNYVKMRNNIKSRPFFIVEWALSFGLLQLGGRDGGGCISCKHDKNKTILHTKYSNVFDNVLLSLVRS